MAARAALAAPASPMAKVTTGMPSGHLHDGQQRVEAVQAPYDGTGTPSTGTMVFCRQHARQMRSTAGLRDDRAQVRVRGPTRGQFGVRWAGGGDRGIRKDPNSSRMRAAACSVGQSESDP